MLETAEGRRVVVAGTGGLPGQTGPDDHRENELQRVASPGSRHKASIMSFSPLSFRQEAAARPA